MLPVIDLHCDLLASIEANANSLNFSSPETNCSLPQLQKGGVCVQTLAIFSDDSQKGVECAKRQLQLYQKLLNTHTDALSFQHPIDRAKLSFLLSIENASCLATEEEPLQKAFDRLLFCSAFTRVLYVSLTWNFENRFGGGAGSSIGLKPDGKELLQFLDHKQIAIDLSHASDPLAYEILEYIDKKGLAITPIASHSNLRSIKNEARNLPDDLAKEIMRRGGVIGLNFIKKFIGSSKEDFFDHIHHALELGGGDALCLGADFYGALDLPEKKWENEKESTYFPEFSNASCYPEFFSFLQEDLWADVVEKIAYKNAESFLSRKGFFSKVYREQETAF